VLAAKPRLPKGRGFFAAFLQAGIFRDRKSLQHPAGEFTADREGRDHNIDGRQAATGATAKRPL